MAPSLPVTEAYAGINSLSSATTTPLALSSSCSHSRTDVAAVVGSLTLVAGTARRCGLFKIAAFHFIPLSISFTFSTSSANTIRTRLHFQTQRFYLEKFFDSILYIAHFCLTPHIRLTIPCHGLDQEVRARTRPSAQCSKL